MESSPCHQKQLTLCLSVIYLRFSLLVPVTVVQEVEISLCKYEYESNCRCEEGWIYTTLGLTPLASNVLVSKQRVDTSHTIAIPSYLSVGMNRYHPRVRHQPLSTSIETKNRDYASICSETPNNLFVFGIYSNQSIELALFSVNCHY